MFKYATSIMWFLFLGLVLLPTMVWADLTVTNGDLEDFTGNSSTGGGQYANVTNWYDSGQWSAWQQDGTRIDPSNGSGHVAMGPDGYIYQSLGTYDSAVDGTLLDYGYELNKFTDGNMGSIIVGVDFFAGSFGDAADGVDILGHANQPTLIHSYVTPMSYNDWEGLGNSGPWNVTGNVVNLSGVAHGTEIWMRLGYAGQDVTGNGYGPLDNVSLSIRTLPFIVQHPEDVLAEVGDTVQLAVVAADNPLTGSLTYQWYQGVSPDTSNPIGMNLPALTVTDVQSADFVRYYCRISNTAGYTDSVSAKIIKKQLLAYWQFDGQGGSPEANDSTGNSYDGQIVGNPSLVTGQLDGALDFGANEYVTIPQVMDQTSMFSLSTWIRTTNDSGYIYSWLFDDGSSGVMRLVSGRLAFVQTTNTGQKTVSGVDTLSDAAWHHAAIVYDRGDVTLFVDGLEEDGATMSAITASGATMTIASKDGLAGLDLQGSLDDVRLYSYSLTPTEVALLYTDVEGPVCVTPPSGDLSGDCVVDIEDLAMLAEDWLQCTRIPDCS